MHLDDVSNIDIKMVSDKIGHSSVIMVEEYFIFSKI